MLKKLLKYDLRGIFKFLIIFYALALFFAILTRIFFAIDGSVVATVIAHICSGTTISMVCSILINNLMRVWVAYKSNLYGDESYLTHTLPVSKKCLYTSKFVSSFITLLVSMIVVVIALFIAYYSKENFEVLKNLVEPIANLFKSSPVLLVLALMFMLFIELFNMLQTGYTGIILGHRKNNNKVAHSVLSGFLVYMMTQIAVLIVIFTIALFNSDIMNFFFTTDNINFDMFATIYIYCSITYIITTIILYFINIKLLNKGVNVD